MSESPSELERDAERVRAEIADTAEQIKDKMSPGQLMDEVVNYFKDGDTNQLLNNLKLQVRDNPLALALVGGGVAWLMMGSGPSAEKGRSRAQSYPSVQNGTAKQPARSSNRYAGASPKPADSTTTGSDSSSEQSWMGDGASKVSEAVGGAMRSVGEGVSAATGSLSATVHDIGDAASESLTSAAEAGSDVGSRVKSTLLDALEREPLVIGALGVAVGAAIGAMLPATRTEQEYLGAASTEAREMAANALSEGFDKAAHVAKDVYSAARDEADRQGFTASGKSTAEKVSDVANAAGSELKTAADRSLAEADKTMDQASDTLSANTKPQT